MKDLMKLMDAYYEKFGDVFPTMCFQTDTREEIADKIDQCIKAEKTAEDLFGLDYSNEY